MTNREASSRKRESKAVNNWCGHHFDAPPGGQRSVYFSSLSTPMFEVNFVFSRRCFFKCQLPGIRSHLPRNKSFSTCRLMRA